MSTNISRFLTTSLPSLHLALTEFLLPLPPYWICFWGTPSSPFTGLDVIYKAPSPGGGLVCPLSAVLSSVPSRVTIALSPGHPHPRAAHACAAAAVRGQVAWKIIVCFQFLLHPNQRLSPLKQAGNSQTIHTIRKLSSKILGKVNRVKQR